MEELDLKADAIPKIISEFAFKMQEVEDLLQVV